jgi:SAM-dependent methyltransferase
MAEQVKGVESHRTLDGQPACAERGERRVPTGSTAPDQQLVADLDASEHQPIERSPSVTDESVDVQEAVGRGYAEPAEAAAHGGSSCSPHEETVFGTFRYTAADLAAMPATAASDWRGWMNPTAVADLRPGEVVLDLGSGDGIDVILSARRVGPSGYTYGLDMSDKMLDLARRYGAEAGITNIEFLKGHMEQIPLPDSSVDVVISNCAIILSSDKRAVLSETARVLRSGGRFAAGDAIADPDVDETTRKEVAERAGCLPALTRDEYTRLLETVGLTDVQITAIDQRHVHARSAIIRARKPS